MTEAEYKAAVASTARLLGYTVGSNKTREEYWIHWKELWFVRDPTGVIIDDTISEYEIPLSHWAVADHLHSAYGITYDRNLVHI